MAYMKIKPTDTLFFRDGKPFNAGSDSWSESSFLPNPSVIWGAMFGVLFREKKVTTKHEDRKKLQIKNIYLYNEEQTTILISAPLDIFVDSDNRKYIAKYRDVDFISNYPLQVVSEIDADQEVKPIENHFIEINSLYEHYTKGYAKNLILYNFDDVFVADYKIGIKIDKEKQTAQENHLYRIDLTQFHEEWSFLIEYESEIEFGNSGILKLGGESKSASYKKVDIPIGLQSANEYKEKTLNELESKKYFKVLLKTSTYFDSGWKPKQDGLICASVGKSSSIGGFDMETNKPKVMKKYIPAGSVYVFEKKDGEIEIKSEDIESYKGFGSFELLTI